MRRLLIWLLLIAPLWGQPITFPPNPFRALQVRDFTVSGAQLSVPRDSQGAEIAERYYTGTWNGDLQIAGKVVAGDTGGNGVWTVQANLFVEAKRVASFEKKLYENKSVDFQLKLPPGTPVGGEVEFFVHAFQMGEDGVRIRGKLDAGPSSNTSKLLQLLDLYQARIPKGLVGSGPQNNVLAAANAKYCPYVCGGYQEQVLTFLNRLRFSKDPAERTLVEGFEYGPIEGADGYHQGVILYESGKDWDTGIVLDPWPNQKPEWVTVQQWASTYRLCRPSTKATGGKGAYPILGGTYQDPELTGNRARTAEEKVMLNSLPPDHKTYFSNLVKNDPEGYKAQVWIRGALQRFRTTGKVFIDCPVAARLVDGSGKYTGLKNDVLAVQVPGTEVFLHPLAPGDNWFQFGFDPAAKLAMELDPLAAGTAKVTVYVHPEKPPRTYQVSLQPGQVRKLNLNPLGDFEAVGKPSTEPPAGPTDIVFYDNTNGGGVTQGQAQPPRVRFEQPFVLSEIQTYHWNSARGATPGTLALRSDDGKTYGPWPASGVDGQGGVKNAFWVSRPGATLPAGTYQVVDSNPGTWSHNGQSSNLGFTILRGHYTKTKPEAQPPSVRDVDQAALAGTYSLTDPSRTTDRYRAQARLLADGSGWIREYQNNKLIVGKYPHTADAEGYYPVRWSYDPKTGRFSLDWSLGGQLPGLGNFAGTVKGSTARFSLSGHWSNGNAATIVLERSEKLDRAGRVWNVVENGVWKGQWTRRPGTNTFDAHWTHPNGAQVKDVIVIESLQGDKVVLFRKGNGGRYTGTLSSDGRVRGTMSWDDGGSRWEGQIVP